jgi:hypothetical protein
MSSTATPYGLRPANLTGGQPFAGGIRQIKIASAYATDIFYGDPVKLVTAGTVEKDTGTTALTPVGVFLGCAYTDTTEGFRTSQYWPASTVASDAVAYVCDDPDAVFKIQADGQVAQTALGANAAVVQTAGSTLIGNSKVALDASTVATTNTLPLRIVGFVDGPDSTVNDAYTDVLVKWNAGMHMYDNATGV